MGHVCALRVQNECGRKIIECGGECDQKGGTALNDHGVDLRLYCFECGEVDGFDKTAM